MGGGGQVVYVTGARQRSHIGEEWEAYDQAVVLRVDLGTRQVEKLFTYTSPPEVCADRKPSIVFKAGSVHGDRLVLCTETEVFTLDTRSKQISDYISLPCFNDVHHARPIDDGHYIVANTGLDMVMEVLADGTVLREWSALPGDAWSRFSRETDYRKVPSTKPHLAHPNYVFLHDGEIWTTRFQQRDALCLTDHVDPIRLGFAGPHDGLRAGNGVYFTSVDGRVIEVDAQTLKLRQVFDLNVVGDRAAGPLGWCRGLLISGEITWVGFSRLRPTRFRQNVKRIKQRLRHRREHEMRPTRLAAYDLRERQLLDEINLEPYQVNAVFSILPGV